MKRTIGDVYTFENEPYKLLENHILPNNKKLSFLYKLNVWAIAFIIVGSGLTVALFWGDLNGTFDVLGVSLYLSSFLVYVVVHELLHGITFVLFSKQPWHTITFGLVLKNGLAYCISKIPVPVRRTRWSLMMPLYVVCIPLYTYALLSDRFALAILAILFASGSVGDIYYLWKLREVDSDKYMYEEAPTKQGYEIGFLLFEKV